MSELYLNKEIVSYYKELKKIRYDVDLLRKIGAELGYHYEVIEEFVKTQKSNFSKIINGNRPLNKDYIIPLEKIFGVPVAKLIEPDAYKFLLNKENIPYVKGIKYYAYMDDMDLYENELSKLTDNSGKPIIFNSDEFGQSFIDYIAEYRSVNAVKFLYETYQLKLKWYDPYFCINDKVFINMKFNNSIPFARMVASMNDAKIFFDIYDTYNMFVALGHYASNACVYEQDDFLKIILDNEYLLNDILLEKEYLYIFSNTEKRTREKRKLENIESVTINTINPIVIGCLRCAINNLDKYKEQAIKILTFAKKHNENVLSKLDDESKVYNINDLGGVSSDDFEIIDLLIYCNAESEDQNINRLLQELPKNENGHFDYLKYKDSKKNKGE